MSNWQLVDGQSNGVAPSEEDTKLFLLCSWNIWSELISFVSLTAHSPWWLGGSHPSCPGTECNICTGCGKCVCWYSYNASLYIRIKVDDLKHTEYTSILSRDRVWVETRFRLVAGFSEHLENVTTNKYGSLTQLHAPRITSYRTQKLFLIFLSRCLVVAFNGGRSPSSGFPNSHRPQLPAFHFSQLQLSTNTESESESESEPDLLYDWRFTANQFFFVPSLLRLTNSDFFNRTLGVIVLIRI
jgi:hypothetical protein